MMFSLRRPSPVFAMLCLLLSSEVWGYDTSGVQTDECPGDPGEPAVIAVSMGVADILGVDDVNQAGKLDLIAAVSWTNQRLTDLAGCRLGVTQVWFPDATVFKSSQLRADTEPKQS